VGFAFFKVFDRLTLDPFAGLEFGSRIALAESGGGREGKHRTRCEGQQSNHSMELNSFHKLVLGLFLDAVIYPINNGMGFGHWPSIRPEWLNHRSCFHAPYLQEVQAL